MRVFLILFLVLVCADGAVAQSDITTVIFVRHAEKVNDGSKDPELSPEGVQRTTRLSQTLSRQPIQAIYSTNYKRTRNTVSPLADAVHLKVELYESMTPELLQKIIQTHKGGTVVICGHSNTTPAMVNQLTGEETLKQFEDSDYGNLIVASVPSEGKTKITRLFY